MNEDFEVIIAMCIPLGGLLYLAMCINTNV